MQVTKKIKFLTIAIADLLCVFFSAAITYLLLFYYVHVSFRNILFLVLVYYGVHFIVGYFLKNHLATIRLFSIHDVRNLGVSNILAGLVTTVVYLAVFDNVSLRFIFLLTVFSIGAMALLRLAWRFYINEREKQHNPLVASQKSGTRTLLVGAGRAGRIFIQSFNRKNGVYRLVGIVDDNPEKRGTYLDGIRVLGSLDQVPEIIESYQVELIMITAPSLPGDQIERILDAANAADIKVNQMPVVESTLSGYQVKYEKTPQEIDIADLLGRKEVELDDSKPLEQISGHTVLVTGAGGSIGSEICRQVIKFAPKKLILLGHGENSIYLINQELRAMNLPNVQIIPVIADVQDGDYMYEVMEKHHPDIVYHAAAHKHVPLMEANPTEAVKNNIYGTYNVARAAKESGVDVFVMVSTDKANNPPNVMGATKRIAEMIVTGLNDDDGGTVFTAVRFGNVLGSRGSVIPLFKKQIAAGGPVTVTDFNMRRFFMTIPEASRLVVQAGANAQGGEIFILDMGEEVYILDLAKKMIKLSGFTEEEIGIVETGIRPGEKLYEELLLTDETTGRRVDDKIFVGKIHNLPLTTIRDFVGSLDLSGQANSDLAQELVAFVHRDTAEE